jgi:hypothetical protein
MITNNHNFLSLLYSFSTLLCLFFLRYFLSILSSRRIIPIFFQVKTVPHFRTLLPLHISYFRPFLPFHPYSFSTPFMCSSCHHASPTSSIVGSPKAENSSGFRPYPSHHPSAFLVQEVMASYKLTYTIYNPCKWQYNEQFLPVVYSRSSSLFVSFFHEAPFRRKGLA